MIAVLVSAGSEYRELTLGRRSLWERGGFSRTREADGYLRLTTFPAGNSSGSVGSWLTITITITITITLTGRPF
jgi:hypothetical protein